MKSGNISHIGHRARGLTGAVLLAATASAACISPTLASARESLTASTSAKGEAAATHLLDAVKDSPTALRVILKQMPKGGDLHNHLGGSPYAEDYLRWAGSAGYCTDKDITRILPPPCPANLTIQHLAEKEPLVFARLVDAISTRGVQKGVGANDASGHSQFFASFDRFGALPDGSDARSLAVTRQMAAGDRVSYAEFMHNPRPLIAAIIAPDETPLTLSDIPAFYARESKTLDATVRAAMADLDRAEAEANKMMQCGTVQADPGCSVEVRYLGYALRDFPPAQAFRSLILSFAMADKDPRYVGINIVQPEDWPIALRDYDLHMAMIRFLAGKYPQVNRTLHAGEVALGLVPPAALKDHILKAINAGAQRIGHGTGIAMEDDAMNTMTRMAKEGIAVEINLSSNNVILGVSGANHPLSLYRRMGVPVMLSTDDEGVLRTDMTNEYVRAVQEQGLSYTDLKTMARTSLEYSFAAGESLWQDRNIGMPVPACSYAFTDQKCQSFLSKNTKAHLQAALEHQFAQFEESTVPAYSEMLLKNGAVQ